MFQQCFVVPGWTRPVRQHAQTQPQQKLCLLQLKKFKNDGLLALTVDRDWNETRTTVKAYKVNLLKI
jgi:hypothetical protein